jgi:hypothetical protein
VSAPFTPPSVPCRQQTQPVVVRHAGRDRRCSSRRNRLRSSRRLCHRWHRRRAFRRAFPAATAPTNPGRDRRDRRRLRGLVVSRSLTWTSSSGRVDASTGRHAHCVLTNYPKLPPLHTTSNFSFLLFHHPPACHIHCRILSLVRVRRVELRSPVWKTGIITDIRHPRRQHYNRYEQ